MINLLDFVFPKKCVNCRKFGEFLCADCFAKVSLLNDFQCPVCLKGSLDGFTHPVCRSKNSIDGVISAVVYNGVIRKLIHEFKYKPYVSDLGDTISEIMSEGLSQNESFYHFISKHSPVIIPIPLGPKRYRERGYNHAEIIASYVAKYFNLKMQSKILLRVKDTRPQYKLNKEARYKNLVDAFGIVKNAKVPNSAILIDDIAASFATLKEAAKVLKRNGSKRILGVTFAKEI